MILKPGQIIDNKWHVVYLIKENPYAESYRVEDESGNPYFMKMYRLKCTPDKLIVDGDVTEIAVSRRLSHKNIVSYIADGKYSDESGECRYLVATYFSGELLSEMLQREAQHQAELDELERRKAELAAEQARLEKEKEKLEKARQKEQEKKEAEKKRKAERRKNKIESQLISTGGRLLRRGLLSILK